MTMLTTAGSLPAHLESAASAVVDSLQDGYSVILFAPARSQAGTLIDWASACVPDVSTPERLGFDGFPTSNLHQKLRRLMRGAVSRDHLGDFLTHVAYRETPTYLCAVLAAGHAAHEADFDGLVSRAVQAGKWPVDAHWRCRVVGLGTTPDEPGKGPYVAWVRTIVRERSGFE